MTTPQTDTCSFCDKRGLPLLLVRHAVAPSMGGAPVAAAPLTPMASGALIEKKPVPIAPIELAGAAHYTTRLLRTGYVYVYDEARTQWEGYYVTANGYYFKLQAKAKAAEKVPEKFSCHTKGHAEVAACITVADPASATKIWIGFSDVRWTAAVRTAHADPAYRRRHMVEIDVKAAMSGGDVGPYARPIAQVSAVVAEYAMTRAKADDAFDWTPFHVDPRPGQAERLKLACDSMRPGKGLIVTLPDPASIAIELAILMTRNADLFTERNPVRKQNLAASTTIAQLEKAVREQAVFREEQAGRELAARLNEDPSFGMFTEQREHLKKLNVVRSPAAQQASNLAWEKYAKKFNQPARQAWDDQFKQQFEDYDRKYIAPLAVKHAAWMQSEALANYFACNFDRNDPDSGLMYTTMLNRCVIATQDKSACYDLYVKWLSGSVTDPKNLLLQAMMFNQKSINDEVDKAVKANYKWEDIPWDHMIEVAGISLSRVRKAAADATAGFIANFAGPLTCMFKKFIDSPTLFRGPLMGLGMVAEHPIVRIEVIGSKEDFRALAAKNLRIAANLDYYLTDGELNKAVDAEMARLRIEGDLISDTTDRSWLMMRSANMRIADMPEDLSFQDRAHWIARQNTFSVATLDELNLQRWTKVVNYDVRCGAIGGLLQAASMFKLFGDQQKALTNEKIDASSRLWLGMVSLAATTADVIGTFMYEKAVLKMGTSLGVNRGVYIAAGGKLFGMGASLALAGFDLRKAVESRKESQSGMAYLYVLSAGFGVTLSVALMCVGLLGAAAIPVIGILIAIVVGIAIAIEYNKDNPIQDWLERCPWGIIPADRYPDFATQHAELTKAMKED